MKKELLSQKQATGYVPSVNADVIERIDLSEAHFNNRMDAFKNDMHRIENEVHSRIDNLNTKLTNRIDKLDTKLTNRIDKLDTKIDNLDTKLTNRIDKLDTRIDKLDTKIDRVENNLKADMHVIKSQVASTNKAIWGLIIAVVASVIITILKQ